MRTDFARPVVSVIICAYTLERLADIREAVASLQQQTRRPDEILLAIDNSRPVYKRLRDEFGDSVSVVLNEDAKGLSATRNLGIASVRGDLVAFLDDDAAAEPNWLEEILTQFEEADVYAVGGRAELVWGRGRPFWFAPELDWTVGGSFWGSPKAIVVVNPHGHNMAFRRIVFATAGGFDTELGRSGNGGQGGEERELCLRLARHFPRAKVIHNPAAVVRHKVPAHRGRWGYLLMRSYGEGRSKAIIQRTARGHARRALDPERDYLRRLIIGGIGSRIVRFWRLRGLVQVAAIILCITATGAGYLRGRMAPPEGVRGEAKLKEGSGKVNGLGQSSIRTQTKGGGPLVILDRDGTINVEKHYITDPDQVELLPNAAEGLRLLNDLGLKAVVVTNQSAISRGDLDMPTLDRIHSRLIELLKERGARIDAIYYCPHGPKDGCSCRKPEVGMLEQAGRDFDVNLSEAFVVGDQSTDIEAGRRVRATTFLIKNGPAPQPLRKQLTKPDRVAPDLLHVARRVAELVDTAVIQP